MKRQFNHFLVLITLLTFLLLWQFTVSAQGRKTHWAADGYQYYAIKSGQLVELDTRDSAKTTVLLTTAMLTPPGKKSLRVENFSISADEKKVLLFY